MNEIEIIKSNELIAKFMGSRYVNEPFKVNEDDKEFTDFWHWSKPEDSFPKCQVTGIEWSTAYMIGNFKYHSSWDWLIPVFNKCQELLRTMEGTIEVARHHLYLSNSLDFLGVLNIEKVYIAVIKFIIWFNSLQIKMSQYKCIREYLIEKYDTNGNQEVIVVRAGDILNEDNIFLNKKYCIKLSDDEQETKI